MVLLFPGDQTVLLVLPDHHGDVAIETPRGLHLLHVHQEAGVTRDRQDTPVGGDEIRGDRAGQREAHRAEAVRDQTRVRFVALIVTCDPHLVCADVG